MYFLFSSDINKVRVFLCKNSLFMKFHDEALYNFNQNRFRSYN